MPRQQTLANRVPGPRLPADQPADAALAQGINGRASLPEEWRPAFDAIRSAFDHAAAGRDDDAREALQSIGLNSPYLDWKLLLRGLLAYYAGDDSRALDNWSRLNTDRMPARLAAPLRFALDPGFRAAQTAKAQMELRARADTLRGGLIPRLRTLLGALSGPYAIDKALRQLEGLLPTLRQQMPNVVPRLAEGFQAAIIAGGNPEDVSRYQNVLGKPADDPKFERLQALALEERQQWRDAHDAWHDYERTLAHFPSWPAADIAWARALVWCRMGRNAADLEHGPFGPVQKLKPPASQCFRRAIELAPELLEAHVLLLRLYHEQNQPEKAEAAGRALLSRFPNHVPTLEILASLARERGDISTSWDYLKQAVTVNPLDRLLRVQLAHAHRARARERAATGQFEAARTDLAAAVELHDGNPAFVILAQAAATAFKAGAAADAEALIQQAAAIGPKLAVGLALVAECTRLKLPPKIKKRFEADFKPVLDGAPPVLTAAALMGVVIDQGAAGDRYLGQKTHAAKVQACVDRVVAACHAEDDLHLLCLTLDVAAWWKSLKAAAVRGQTLFATNPFFPYYAAKAYCELDDRSVWRARPLIDKAERLAQRQPPNDLLARMLSDLGELRRRIEAQVSPFGMFNQLIDVLDEAQSYSADV